MGRESIGQHAAAADAVQILCELAGFEHFLDALDDGIMLFDATLRLRALNRVARQLTGLDESALGATLDECLARSTLEWPVRPVLAPGALAATDAAPAAPAAAPHDGTVSANHRADHAAAGDPGARTGGSGAAPLRRRDHLLMAAAGRPILAAERPWRGAPGTPPGLLILLRDLALLDHTRRNLAGEREVKVFRFLSDRAGLPDFEAQRRVAPALDTALEHGERALRQGARLLLAGESGCGKTELARHLHRAVGMPGEPFVHVNCGAIPESLFESEMFGYERGAFTGALASGNRGLLEAADGGTLFLDEIGEIPLTLQAKLLKFLEDHLVQRVGARTARRVDVRIIAATNRDLHQLIDDGLFRQDLYYRLAVFVLDIPPLRAQPGLKAHLVDHFLAAANRVRSPRLRLSPACRAALLAYPFPGNIRELHNVVQHLSIVAEELAEPAHIPTALASGTGSEDDSGPSLQADGGAGMAASRATGTVMDAAGAPDTASSPLLREQLRDFERMLIDAAILRHGSKRAAARALGVDIGTIVRKTR